MCCPTAELQPDILGFLAEDEARRFGLSAVLRLKSRKSRAKKD
jgi:hypothetical protein